MQYSYYPVAPPMPMPPTRSMRGAAAVVPVNPNYVPFFPVGTAYPTAPMGAPIAIPPANPPSGSGGTSLFVASLPQSVDDMYLINLFSSCGAVISAKIIRDKMTNVSKGEEKSKTRYCVTSSHTNLHFFRLWICHNGQL